MGNIVMSYAPSTFQAGTGEDFFLKEGYLTGMAPIISARYTIPAFDGQDGTAVTISGSVAKATTGNAECWAGWNLGATYTKLLIVAYVQPGNTSAYMGIGAKVDVIPVGSIKPDAYQTRYADAYGAADMGKYVGTSYTSLASETTILQDSALTAPVWGIAFYLDPTLGSEVLKTFFKTGSSKWFQTMEVTGDTAHTSFQSVYLRYDGDDCRYITPIMVWGS